MNVVSACIHIPLEVNLNRYSLISSFVVWVPVQWQRLGPPNLHILLVHGIMEKKFYSTGCLVLNVCGQNPVVIKWGRTDAVICYVLDLSRIRRSAVDITIGLRTEWSGV